MSKVLIRKPFVSELASVQALVQTVVDETYGGLWAAPPLPVDEEDWSHALVAILDGRMVGMVLTQAEWVSDLWVLQEARRLCTGQKLLEKAEDAIASRG